MPASTPQADLPARDGGGHALRILVVDDDLNVARAMCRRLRGHDIQVAGSGIEAVELCLQGDFDLILCDVMMPNLSGPGVHQRLSILRPEMVPRIVFVTGGIFTDDVIAFMEKVTNLVLEKPVDRVALAAAISAAAAVAKARRAPG